MKCWSKAGISGNGSPLLLSPSISLNQMLGGGRTPRAKTVALGKDVQQAERRGELAIGLRSQDAAPHSGD